MTATAESVGLSSERLGNITTKFQGYVDNNQAPGFVILIARKGEIAYYETIGYSDLESQTPVEKDRLSLADSLPNAQERNEMPFF